MDPWSAAIMGGSALLGNVLGMTSSSAAAGAANSQNLNMAWENLSRQNDFFQQQKALAYHTLDRQDVEAGRAREFAERLFHLGNNYSSGMFDRSAALQREFAQNGILWRAQDARRAGIHPLFAMGGGGASFTPPAISVGGGGGAGANIGGPGLSLPGGVDAGAVSSDPGRFLASMGQDVGRAIAATMTPAQRQTDQVNAMEVERHQWAKDEHEMRMAYAAARLSVLNQEQKRAGMAGHEKGGAMGPTGLVQTKPYELTQGARPDSPSVGGGQPSVEWRVVGGGLTAMPAKDLNIDDATSPGYASWMVPNKLEPFFQKNPRSKPPTEVWKRIWPHAQDVTHHFGSWFPVYDRPYPPFTGLRNTPGEGPLTRPGSVKGMFIDRR